MLSGLNIEAPLITLMLIDFDILTLDELNVAFSAGCYNHCCSSHVGYGHDEY